MLRNHGNAPSQWCDRGALYLVSVAERLYVEERYTTWQGHFSLAAVMFQHYNYNVPAGTLMLYKKEDAL
jgi:hypothetical protein